jgi:hypothetical protein
VCFANGHDVDSVDLLRLVLQAPLDAAHQLRDLSTGQAIFDVNPGHNPHLARAGEGEEEFANGGHTGVPKEDGSYSLLVNWPEWLGVLISVAPRPFGMNAFLSSELSHGTAACARPASRFGS